MLPVAFVLAAILATVSHATDVHPCPSSQGVTFNATKVELSPCTKEPCSFKHGDTVNVKITFTAVDDSATLKSSVFGVVLGIPVEFPLPNSDGCTKSSVTCPIKKGQTYTYDSSFQVLDSYPEITLVVMWKLDGATTNNVCFTFPMSIKDPEN